MLATNLENPWQHLPLCNSVLCWLRVPRSPAAGSERSSSGAVRLTGARAGKLSQTVHGAFVPESVEPARRCTITIAPCANEVCPPFCHSNNGVS